MLPRRTQKNATRRRAILAESLEPLRGGLKTLMKSTVARFCHEELRLRYDVERVGDTDPPSTGGRGVRRPCGRLGGAVAISLFSMAIRSRRGKQISVRTHIWRCSCKNRVLPHLSNTALGYGGACYRTPTAPQRTEFVIKGPPWSWY